MQKPKKLLYILSHPIQYQTPLIQYLQKCPEFELEVLYMTEHTIKGHVDPQFGKKIEWDIPMLEGYNFSFLPNISRKPSVSGKFLGIINTEIIDRLKSVKPDAIWLHGWGYFGSWQIILAAKLLNIKLLFRAETPLNQENTSGYKWKLKKMLLKESFSDFLYIGKQNYNLYVEAGVPKSSLFYTPYVVDNSFFQQEYLKRKDDKHSLKKSLNIPEAATVIVFVGKYIGKKRPMDLLKAFFRVAAEYKEAYLILVGEGEDRPLLEQEISVKNLGDRIRLTGFVNQSKISDYYAVADIFVLPSGIGETWGLVVNEAMNFKLPLVVSDLVGSAVDLVEEGKNGYTYPCGNVEKLSHYLALLLSDNQLRDNLGAHSRAIVEGFSFEQVKEGILKALNKK